MNNLRRSATEAQLGLEFESTFKTVFEFELEYELKPKSTFDFGFDFEFDFEPVFEFVLRVRVRFRGRVRVRVRVRVQVQVPVNVRIGTLPEKITPGDTQVGSQIALWLGTKPNRSELRNRNCQSCSIRNPWPAVGSLTIAAMGTGLDTFVTPVL